MAILALQNPVFAPAMRIIQSITNANPAVVTTTFDHGYISGTIVRLDIPFADGMQQAHGKTGEIVVISDTAFSISIDTTLFDAFNFNGSNTQYGQVVPIGENNAILTAAVQNILTSNSTVS